MNKTVKIIMGVVLIVALVAGGIYFSGAVGDGGQGLLRKKDSKTIDYSKNVKKKPKSTDGIYMPKEKPVPVLPDPDFSYVFDICLYDDFTNAEKALLAEASVRCSYADALWGYDVSDIIDLWKAGVNVSYFRFFAGKLTVSDIIELWEEAWSTPREYVMRFLESCSMQIDAAAIARAHRDGVAAEDMPCPFGNLRYAPYFPKIRF